MNIISYLFRKILLFRIEMDKNGIKQKEVATVCFVKGKARVGEWKSFEAGAFSKWKNSPALIVVTGEGIISKAYDKQDATCKRIMKDPELLWDVEEEKGRQPMISFLRRGSLSGFLQTVSLHHLALIDTWIYSADIEYDIQTRLEKLYLAHFKSTALWKSSDCRDILANILFQKIFLPVLLSVFVLLLGNYFLHSYYTKQYQQKQNIIYRSERDTRASSLHEKKKNQLLGGYNQIPNQSFALLADRIASYVPVNLFLTSMQVFPLGKSPNIKEKKTLHVDYRLIRLKGMVETPGSVTLLSQLLESDKLFDKVKVVRLGRKKNTELFEFEMEITL